MRIGDFASLNVKIFFIWNVTLCSQVERCDHYKTCCHHLRVEMEKAVFSKALLPYYCTTWYYLLEDCSIENMIT
jgi:hypothetical protein